MHAALNPAASIAIIILQVENLVQRLVREEHFALAAYVTKRWRLDACSVWEQWAHSLIL